VGVTWANRRRTLCADCVEGDRLLRTRAGRQYLIALWHQAHTAARVHRRGDDDV
jgi:hypothetical protein